MIRVWIRFGSRWPDFTHFDWKRGSFVVSSMRVLDVVSSPPSTTQVPRASGEPVRAHSSRLISKFGAVGLAAGRSSQPGLPKATVQMKQVKFVRPIALAFWPLPSSNWLIRGILAREGP